MSRRYLVTEIGDDLSLPAVVASMVGGDRSWQAVLSICEEVMSRKEGAIFRTMGQENGDTSRPYEVRSSEELGRYLVATRDLSPGDLVLTETPLVFAPKANADPDATMPCVGCYIPVVTEVGERCPSCGWPVCSGNCPGLKDPRHHAAECSILSLRPACALDNMSNYYRHDALLPLRCLLLQKNDPEKWRKLIEMQSHMECRKPGTEAYDEANEFIVQYLMVNFLNLLGTLEKELNTKLIPELSSELIHQICGIIDTNALEIRLNTGTELSALFTNTCIMEHSCIANTRHNFEVSPKDKSNLYKITVRVVVPVAKDKHITTMYSHALWGTQARRQHLRDTKYFSCKCERCSDRTELGTYLSAMKCLGDGRNSCDGIHLPEDPLDDDTEWACSKCAVKLGNSQVNMVIAQMGEEVDSVQAMNPSVPILENILARLSTFLHPNHYHLYSIKHSLIQLYGRHPNYVSLDILDRKIRICKELLAVTNVLDPGNARLSLYNAVLHHELHSALVTKCRNLNTGESKKAKKDMKRLLIEAKSSIHEALNALKNEIDERAGQQLFIVIKKSEEDFVRFCKEKTISI